MNICCEKAAGKGVCFMQMHIKSKIIGLLFLAVGIGYLGAAMDWWDFSVFFPGWWTLFLLVPAVFSFFEDGLHFGNSLVFLLGAYLLCSANDWISFRLTWGMIVAVALILHGCRMIIGDSFLKLRHGDSLLHEEDTRRDLRSATYFGNKRVHAKGIVYSVKAESVFGSQVIDLADADLRECSYVKLEAVFGSIDLLVSDQIHYRVKSENIFGNTRVEHHPEGSQDLSVDVSCVFGTVNLRKVHIEDDILEGKYKEKPAE